MDTFTLDVLNTFIVCAKTNTYVGKAPHCLSYRPGSQDLQFHAGDFAYLDSYYGGADFIGEEVVYFKNQPVWVMNYYGRLLKPDLIAAWEVGALIQESLSQMYAEGRFLGGFEHSHGSRTYFDRNERDITSFTGCEWITQDGTRVYELVYHGGLIK